MNSQNRPINGKSPKAMNNNAGAGFYDDILINSEDLALFGDISIYAKALSDIEDVKKDPSVDKTRTAVNGMISDYNKTLSENRENRENVKFIRNAFSENEIKPDIRNSDIKEITAEWVREWHRNKQMSGATDSKAEEIKDFINSSLKSEVAASAEEIQPTTKRIFSRSLYIRYISLLAASLVGAVILFKTLLPSSNPEKVFNTYYKSFDAVSPVTRSINSDAGGIYTSAIGNYKSGDYQSAATGFSKAVLNDPSFGSPRFFLGLTDMALGNYDQAVSQLTTAVNGSGEYVKEAQWYLGLAYLKAGNTLKASACFEDLAHSDGFYRERSEKILRRLK